MPAKRTTKKTTAPRKPATGPATVHRRVTPAEPEPRRAEAATEGGVDVCPRCGTTTFGPEERTRVDGRRTVRYTVLVCERGHTFARPARR